MDRRTFLTVVGAAPAVTVAGCQQVDTSPPKPWPPIKALRELVLADVEPAITFMPLRRKP